jgi:hypothetical protein
MASMDNYVKGPWGEQTPYPPGEYKSLCIIPGDFLNEGEISINMWIYSPPAQPSELFHVRLMDAAGVKIEDKYNPGGVRGSFPYEWGFPPVIRPRLQWITQKTNHGEIDNIVNYRLPDGLSDQNNCHN